MSKLRLKNSVLLALTIWSMNLWGQHVLIPTGTTTSITLQKIENTIVINGVHNFLAKCTDNCDQLVLLNPPGPLNYFNGHLNILDTNTFYVSSFMASVPYHNIIFKTNDGGQNWTSVLDTISGDFFRLGLFVFDTNRIVLPVSLYRNLVTNNGGDNWELGTQHGINFISTSIKVNDSVAIAGSVQQFSMTKNKGNTWSGTGFVQSAPTDFFSTSGDSIYVVTDGGTGVYFCYIFGLPQNSRVDKLIPMMEPAGIYVVSKNEIYITGKCWPQETGRIMKTTDLGNTWSYYDIPESETLYEMVFLNDTIALIGGQNGVLLKWNKNSPMTEWGLGISENSNGAVSATAYPNPTTQQQELDVNTIAGERIEIQLYDIKGRNCGLVYSGVADGDKLSISVNLSHLNAGIYVYRLQVGDCNGQIRFVKQ